MAAIVTSSKPRIRIGPREREILFERLKASNPNPTTELHYGSTFQLLIAVILSAQATDVSVNKATKHLFQVAPDAPSMLAVGERRLKSLISTIGLYNSKARHILKTCAYLIRDYGGVVPHDRKALEALPGVGRKTANVILNTAFGEPTIAVDTHIFRVANRLGLAPGRTVREVEDRLARIVPRRFRTDAHHWLILHGRYTCKARAPACSRCILFDLCTYRDKVRPWILPGSPQVSVVGLDHKPVSRRPQYAKRLRART
ncbi:MAG TPA: endonuclease III [Acidiferrobacter sp.]|nr:endonuclease III [Acidiferrobacter sp.]